MLYPEDESVGVSGKQRMFIQMNCIVLVQQTNYVHRQNSIAFCEFFIKSWKVKDFSKCRKMCEMRFELNFPKIPPAFLLSWGCKKSMEGL